MKRATTGNTTPVSDREDRTDLNRVQALADDDIAADRDNPRTTPDDWAGAVMKRGDMVLGRTPGRRGPGRKPAKVAIQLRLPPDVLERWKATGPGWQTRMAEDLAKHAP
ncbi:BrnA antitoxin family protein [Azotobacter vinelandii]|uniref:BrnA antitoxin family protein n=1 Tax=Azotobacter TaxID=352 RepID=UPI00091593F0|nr:BrnA antitoxin family protein [Azotobacter vinelandii]WKN23651.1 BrnA antitoxin family protein [Azotobacter vinelandii]GLK61361.1 hypothetical protein GCM10017624_35240 [Azotobacter vinelandii]SFX99257.1 BrnA antitoxin of type II toxin-antitoxin system [Azotobacter vinelandii]